MAGIRSESDNGKLDANIDAVDAMATMMRNSGTISPTTTSRASVPLSNTMNLPSCVAETSRPLHEDAFCKVQRPRD